MCQRDQREGRTSNPWVHGVPPPEGLANPGSMVCQKDQIEGGTSKPSRGSPQARRPESGDGRVEWSVPC